MGMVVVAEDPIERRIYLEMRVDWRPRLEASASNTKASSVHAWPSLVREWREQLKG
jgi:hypothetical protein